MTTTVLGGVYFAYDLAFAPVGIFIGAAVGLMARRGVFNRLSSIIFSGLGMGIGSGVMSVYVLIFSFSGRPRKGPQNLTKFYEMIFQILVVLHRVPGANGALKAKPDQVHAEQARPGTRLLLEGVDPLRDVGGAVHRLLADLDHGFAGLDALVGRRRVGVDAGDDDALDGVLEGRGRAQGVADGVVDNLRDHVAVRAGDDEARALRRAVDVLAHALVADLAGDSLRLAPLDRVSHGHLPAFPTLRRTFSPA